jgi:hypothetical protein
VSSRTARAIQRNPVLKNQNQPNKQTKKKTLKKNPKKPKHHQNEKMEKKKGSGILGEKPNMKTQVSE